MWVCRWISSPTDLILFYFFHKTGLGKLNTVCDSAFTGVGTVPIHTPIARNCFNILRSQKHCLNFVRKYCFSVTTHILIWISTKNTPQVIVQLLNFWANLHVSWPIFLCTDNRMDANIYSYKLCWSYYHPDKYNTMSQTVWKA